MEGGLRRCRRREISNTMKNMAKKRMGLERGTGAGVEADARKKEEKRGRKKGRKRRAVVEGGEEHEEMRTRERHKEGRGSSAGRKKSIGRAGTQC